MASIITRRSALSCARSCSASTVAPRLFPVTRLTLNLNRTSNNTPKSSRNFHTTIKMSEGFSNTNVQNPDPYKEKNKEEPPLKEKIEDLVSFIERCKFCMMATRTKDGLIASRCMALAGKEGNGIDLIFHANTESGKTDDLQSDPDINLGFLNNSGEWASISGKAEIVTDRGLVHKYYSPALKAWIGDLGDGKHDGGPDDPRVCVIKVNAITAQYATSKKTAVGGFVEFAKGVTTGDAPSVNKLRYLDEKDLDQWRSNSQTKSEL